MSTKQLNTLGRGTTFLELSVEELGGYETPFPSLPEQKQIAAFLDRETAKIDTLIDKQKKLIALLKEKRQATISHAVTTGLNPNAPMKDSGIPWLGKIPAHWDISQIKYLAYVNDGNHGEEYPKGSDYSDIDNGVPFIRGGNMKELTIDAKEMLYITKEKNESMRKGRLKTGDILFMNRGDIGKLAMIPEAFRDANLNSQIAYIRANSSVIENNFFLYYLASNAVKNLVSSLKMGSVLTQFPIGDLIQIHVPLPPKEEQKKLAEFAANKIAKIDRLISKSEQAIELIQERRTALISAAVTGKIDVGNISVQEYEELNVDGQNYGAS